MTYLNQLIKRFDAEVRSEHIVYDWDAGWCYSGIDHPVMEIADKNLGPEELEEFGIHADEWLSENDGMYYHMCDVVGNKLVNQVEEMEGDEAKKYAVGLITYLEKYDGGTLAMKKIAELQKYIQEN